MARQSPYMSSAQFSYPSNYQQRDNRYATNSNVETAMGLNRRPSLLAGYHNPFTSPERASLAYYQSLGPMSMGPHADEHSKRSRYLPGGNLSVNSQLLPLSIDVKKEQQQQQVYQPQTEAISPTPDDPKNDCSIRDSAIIRNAISKLEAEIDITMKKLHRAKLSQSEIKSQADRSAADEDDNDDLLRTNGSQTLIEKILHDNRKKAEDSQKQFHHLNNNFDFTIPFYQEANDLESIQRIRRQYMNVMKTRLKEYFKKKQQTCQHRMKSQINKYDEIYQRWQKSIEKDEKLQVNKDLSTYRDIFEKTFPELRKTREDKEKKQSNITDSSPSEQQQQQQLTVSNPLEQDTEEDEEKMRKSSIVTPILYNRQQRRHPYFNQNGLIKRDAVEFYKERTKMPFWSADERQIFIEKFTQSPKNFGYISSFLENKTTEQCVQFYYMTKKSENYKNLLRKQGQANRRKAKQTTTTTTTTVTSSTTIETTLVTKVTSSNTIVSSTSQQLIGQESDRLENDEPNSGDGNEEKRANKNRCQFLSCTTEKLGKKKNRKNRLRAFPNKWNDLSAEYQEAIRRSLQIPTNVQRCCTRCYEKLIIQIRQRQEEEDEDDDETSKNSKTNPDEQQSKPNKEWAENEIQLFREALQKYPNDWTRIAEYVHRDEQNCRNFYEIFRKKKTLIDDEQNIDEDNGSMSGSEGAPSRLTKSREIDDDNDDEQQKTIVNEDSNDSTHGMIIDDVDEQTSTIDEKKSKSSTGVTTLGSLVEQEIAKTLYQTDKRAANPEISQDKTTTTPTIPPPLVTITKSRSPPLPSHNQQAFSSKGSIMRGTPISPSNKPISIDTSNVHSHHFSNPRSEFAHHSSPHIKSSKILDQQQLYLQQQQQQQQHPQAAAYMRHYSPNSFPNRPSSTSSKPSAIDASNTDTYETLRADFVTSRYLTSTHSPSHERQTRHPTEQRSPSQQLLPPPTAIVPPSSSSSSHSQQQAALLAASQILASSGMYPQDLLNSGLLPYSHYYGSLPGNSFYVDPRLMHEFNSATNNEQLKNLRANRHLPSAHSPPEPSAYSAKRHSLENLEHMRYPSNDYPTSLWRQQNLNNPQLHSQMKSNENPLLKLNEFARHSARVPSALDRDARSPDEFHHRINQVRSTVDNPAGHFQRVEGHNHHKSSSNPNFNYSDSPSDGGSSAYSRPTSHLHKPHSSHHHHTSNSSNRSTLIPSSQISPHHSSPYLYHGLHHSPVGTISPQQHQSHYSQSQRNLHQNESIRNPKESISIQEFMKQRVNDFVASTNPENRSSNNDFSHTESSNGQSVHLLQSGAKIIDNADQPILIDGDDDSDSIREQHDFDGNSRINPDVNKSTSDYDTSEKRRDSSIKKILSNQPLENKEYVEINQKVQNCTVGASKVHSNTDGTNIERSNSAGGRETARSRGSITMRMLMGANEIYADGKAKPMTANELTNEQSNKRAASPPQDKAQSLEYLIRGELIRACPTLPKNDESASIFQNRRLSPTSQQRISSKRMRTSPRDSSDNSRQTSDISSNIRDPFALQTSTKTSHHSSSSPSNNPERSWQSYVQQQYQQAFGIKSSRPTGSGSITQGSPISPNTRVTTDQQQYPSAANNQLVNPRYSHYMNKNESQFSPSRQSSTSPFDHSPKGKFVRRAQETLSTSSSDIAQESSLIINVDPPTNTKSPSPISPSATNSSHSLKKRLISEYEQEQQQQRMSSPVKSPTVAEVAVTSPPESIKIEVINEQTTDSNVEQAPSEDISDVKPEPEPPQETTEPSSAEDPPESST